jgi:hypothetical protein
MGKVKRPSLPEIPEVKISEVKISGRSHFSGKPVRVEKRLSVTRDRYRVELEPGRQPGNNWIREHRGGLSGTIGPEVIKRSAQRFRKKPPPVPPSKEPKTDPVSQTVENFATALSATLPGLGPVMGAPLMMGLAIVRGIGKNLVSNIRQAQMRESLVPREEMMGITHTPLTDKLPPVYVGFVYLDAQGNITRKDLARDLYLSEGPVTAQSYPQPGERAVGVRVDSQGNLLEWDAEAPGLNEVQFFTMHDFDQNSQTQTAQNQFRQDHPFWEQMVRREGMGNILVDFHKMTQAAFKNKPAGRGAVTLRLALRKTESGYELDQVYGNRPLPTERFEAVFDLTLRRGAEPHQYKMDWKVQHGHLPYDLQWALSYLRRRGA